MTLRELAFEIRDAILHGQDSFTKDEAEFIIEGNDIDRVKLSEEVDSLVWKARKTSFLPEDYQNEVSYWCF